MFAPTSPARAFAALASLLFLRVHAEDIAPDCVPAADHSNYGLNKTTGAWCPWSYDAYWKPEASANLIHPEFY
jgi:hypothetical protein